MRKLFTLLIIMFLWTGSSWGQAETMLSSSEDDMAKTKKSVNHPMKSENIAGIKIPNIQTSNISPKATTTIYHTQDFEATFTGSPAAPAGWTQSRFVLLGDGLPEAGGINGEKDWQQNIWTGTAWSVLGYAGIRPTGAVSGTGVLFMEDGYFGSTTSAGFGSRRVETPTVDISSATSPYVRFYYFFAGPSSNLNVRVMASKDDGDTWAPIMIVSPNAGTTAAMTTATPWQRINVLIPEDFRTANAKFGIEMTNTWGTNDVFIDDFSIEDFTPTTITSEASGLWSAAATWSGGVVPTSDNHVIIDAGHVVSADVNIARCQNMTINGTLQYSGTSTTQLIDIYGNLTVNSGGLLSSFFSTTGKRTYVGGSVINNGTLNFSIGAGNLVWKGGASATYSGSGSISTFISNIWHANAGGVTYNAPVEVRNVVGLYMGDVNPNGNLTVGNPIVTIQTVERTSFGSFTQAPTWTSGITRNVSYITANLHVPSKTLYYTGYEIPVVGGVGILGGTLVMSTYDNVQLSTPLELGTATTGVLTLTRGILITSNTNLLTLNSFVAGHAGTAASILTPPITHGSYISGPMRINFPVTGTATRNFPLGVGTGFNGSTPNSNVLKLVALSSSAAWTGSTVKMSIVGAPSGTVNSPLNYLMGSYAYRADLLGGDDLPATTTITIRGINYTFGNSDNLFGDQGQLRIAQASSLSGPWSERSATTGTGSFVNNTYYSRTTAVAAPGPIAPLATYGEYFALASTATVIGPTGVTATAISASQINVAFTPNIFSNNVVIVFNTTGVFTDPAGPPPALNNDFAGGTIIYNGLVSPFLHSGLSAASTYYYKLFSYDGANYSPGATANATTFCDTEAAPTAVQDFSTYTGAAPPPVCWQEATGVLTANSTLTYGSSEWLSSTGFANTGSNKGVRVNLYASGNDWIISQSIDLGATPGLFRVKFNMAVTSYLGTAAQATLGTHVVNVVVSTDNGVTWSDANIIKTYTGPGTYSNTGQIELINLTGYSGVVKIGFYETTTSTSPDIDFHIDDFLVEAIPSTPTLSVSPVSLDCGYAASGSYSAEKIYALSGESLTGAPGQIAVAAPANFEVSLTPGSGFGSSVNVDYAASTLAATNIYVRCAPTAVNTYYTGDISNTGGGAAVKYVAVTGNSDVFNAYCASNATSAADEDIFNVTLGTLNNTSDCNTLAPGPGSIKNQYSNYMTTVAAPDLEQGSTNAFSVQVGTCGTGTYTNKVSIFFDFNQDGDFDDSGETAYVGAAASGANTVIGNITVPGGAVLGNTIMRVVNVETSGTVNACGTYSWGETEDYKVNITLATSPILSVNPGSINFGSVPSGNTSAEFSYTLSGLNLSPADGVITVTPPANFEVSTVMGGPYSAAPITVNYSSGTLASTPVYAVFKPTSAATNYSGNIVNSGGGATPVNVAVIGSSPCDVVATFTENFDLLTTPALPQCWTKVGAEGSATTQSTNSFSAPNCMYIYAASGTYGATVAMTELSNLGAATHRLKFMLRANFTVGGVVQVGYMTDRTDPASFVMLQSFTTTSTSVYQECTVDPGNLPGASTTLAFRMPPTPGYSALIDNVEWVVIPTSTLSWNNLQWPGSATILANQSENIYAQCWEPGVTEAAGPGVGIECWIGYSTDNTNPNTWTNWVPATYNFGVDPNNNDEYQASLGAAQGLVPGTYYYASRFRYLSGPFTYGGFSGGPWNGTSNVSGVLTVNPVPPATLPFNEGFESGQGNWIAVNAGQTNKWFVGTATAKTGTQSVYVSNDGGVTNAYSDNAASVSHFYRDITFPAGTNPFNLKFSWKGGGEGTTILYDYLRVYVVPTSTVPVAGTQLASGQVGTSYLLQANWQDVTLELDNTYAGQTWRLVFSWRNDGSLGTQPPAAVDDIIVEVQAPLTKTLNLTSVLLEGLYAGGGLLNQAQGDSGPQFGAGVADEITVELHNGAAYGTILHTATVELSTSGAASVTDIPGALSGNYYITVKHRNSVQTVSATAVSFAGSVISQSFATPADVFGGNLQLMIDNGYAIFGGDVNQDGGVDTSDMTEVDNDSADYAVGYLAADVNGDGSVDTSDMTIVDNNNANYVGAVTP
jgi:hypothetical protein